MSLKADFEARFANDSRIDLIAINEIWSTLDPAYKCYYGAEYGSGGCDDEAIFLLIAHLSFSELGTDGGTGSNKSVASKSVGSVSLTYTAGSETSPYWQFFNTTTYGQRFLQIISKNRGAYFV